LEEIPASLDFLEETPLIYIYIYTGREREREKEKEREEEEEERCMLLNNKFC